MDVDSDSEDRAGWSTVAASDPSAQQSTSRGGRTAILEEEPDLQQGVAAAIMVANRKG